MNQLIEFVSTINYLRGSHNPDSVIEPGNMFIRMDEKGRPNICIAMRSGARTVFMGKSFHDCETFLSGMEYMLLD